MEISDQAGKSNILLGVVVLGAVVVGAALIMVFSGTGSDDAASILDKEVVEPTKEVLDTTKSTALSPDQEPEVEEEVPKMFRSADAQGNSLWIVNEHVDIHLPGKGKTLKARKIASATGRKMTHFKSPEMSSAKLQEHPALKRKDKGKVEQKGEESGDGEGSSSGSEGSGGGQVGGGKGSGK